MREHRRTQATVPNKAQPDTFHPTDALELQRRPKGDPLRGGIMTTPPRDPARRRGGILIHRDGGDGPRFGDGASM
jgi:hypothetical protein